MNPSDRLDPSDLSDLSDPSEFDSWTHRSRRQYEGINVGLGAPGLGPPRLGVLRAQGVPSEPSAHLWSEAMFSSPYNF